MIEPEEVRALVVCSPERLGLLAESMGIPFQEAQDIRSQATNLVLGKCSLCGAPAPSGICEECQASNSSMFNCSGAEFLQKLKPATVVLKRTCTECNAPVALSASYLLWKIIRRPAAKPKGLCKACLKNRKSKKRAESSSNAATRSSNFMFRPFDGHKALEAMKETLRKTTDRSAISKKGSNTEKHRVFQVKEEWTSKTPVYNSFAPDLLVYPEEHMSEQQAASPQKEKHTKNPFTTDPGKVANLLGQLSSAPSAKEAEKILIENRKTLTGAFHDIRRAERVGMPLYERFLNRAAENRVWDKIRLARDGVLTGVACVFGWKGLKWVIGYIRS